MSIYFLVEGETETKLYPRWLKYLIPEYTRVELAEDAKDNNYCIVSARGAPLWKELEDAIKTVNEFPQYKHLLLCMDSDHLSSNEIILDAQAHLEERKIKTIQSELVYIIQNRCIETWLLANKAIIDENKHREFCQKYVDFYDVSAYCPELMNKPDWCKIKSKNAITRFHQEYLKAIIPNYSKSNPHQAQTKEFLNELMERVQADREHLHSFQKLLDFCKKICIN